MSNVSKTVNGSEWMEQLPEFDELFIKNDEDNDKGYILEVDVEYPKNYYFFIVIYHFCLEERKFKNARNLFVTYITKKTTLCT